VSQTAQAREGRVSAVLPQKFQTLRHTSGGVFATFEFEGNGTAGLGQLAV
jgi:hypothetical protein